MSRNQKYISNLLCDAQLHRSDFFFEDDLDYHAEPIEAVDSNNYFAFKLELHEKKRKVGDLIYLASKGNEEEWEEVTPHLVDLIKPPLKSILVNITEKDNQIELTYKKENEIIKKNYKLERNIPAKQIVKKSFKILSRDNGI
jgi:hypothetical protein